ncbi:MAG: hypothetical protein ACKVOJ_03010 [Sphingomonadaceae bacterium]
MDADMGAGAGGEDVEEAGVVQLADVAVPHGDRAVNRLPLRAVHVENEAVGVDFAQGIAGGEGALGGASYFIS